MLKNAPTLAIVAVHTDENEPSRVQVKNNEITLTHYLVPRFACEHSPSWLWNPSWALNSEYKYW